MINYLKVFGLSLFLHSLALGLLLAAGGRQTGSGVYPRLDLARLEISSLPDNAGLKTETARPERESAGLYADEPDEQEAIAEKDSPPRTRAVPLPGGQTGRTDQDARYGNNAHIAPGAAAGETETGLYLETQFQNILQYVRRHLIYPERARRLGWSGTATVTFVITQDGGVEELALRESSGQAVLDRAAREAVLAAVPFPPPPVRARIVLPIAFKLN
ncbi:MAG: energy transducer TonB [Desulfovibrionaceae bacterium]|nr:energy transducer TonB [Desulfovibrionaceae bacterium]